MSLGFPALMLRLWNDDCGAIIATEYLMLGGILTLGGVSGLAALRDAHNDEMQEFGTSLHEVNKAYRDEALRHMPKGKARSVVDAGAASQNALPTP